MVPIAIRQLRKEFGQTAAVADVSLDVARGELFFLLGPSGCGKTTLLRMIAGLIPVTSGTIHFGERDVTMLPANKRNAAMVFQSYALWPHMTAAQNVAFGLEVRKVPRRERQQRVKAALESVQLAELADRRPAQMSGGQQQRVSLARALAVNPDVLLLDEPLSNLDAGLRIQMRREIRQLVQRTNVTAVYVTHDQDEALTMADRMGVMQAGRLVQVGAPEQVYARPADRFVAGFLGQANFVTARILGRENGAVMLDSPLGKIQSRTFPEGTPEQGSVTCLIRPEAIRLLDDNQPHDQALEATLREREFHGDRVQMHIKVGESTTLMLTTPELRASVAQDQRIRVGLDPRDVVLLLR